MKIRIIMFWVIPLCLLVGPSALFGQIVHDGSLGHGGTLSGPNFSIPATSGKTVGTNLFHSFSQFNIQTGETATFTAPANIANIIARITGGRSSNIQGTLATRLDGNPSTPHPANFYLINPAGVIFGPGASLDVGGSFVVTTADFLKLSDGQKFTAAPGPSDAFLTTAAPAAFGFLTPTPAPVSVNETALRVPDGKVLSVVSGGVDGVGNNSFTVPSIATDGTLGAKLTLAHPDYLIGQDLGTTVGHNLFHSFSRFGLATNESAIFTASPDIQNIIARVTGGSPSQFNGTLRTQVDSNPATSRPANFYLINPAGVIFGRSATLDVGGSFVVTTADYLKLTDGQRFSAIPGDNDEVLTSAAPSAFVFLASHPGGVTVNSGAPDSEVHLTVPSGASTSVGSLSIVGGDIQITNGVLAAPGGRVNLVAVSKPTEVVIDAANPNADLAAIHADISAGGNVNISGDSQVQVQKLLTGGSGSVIVRAMNLTIAGPSKMIAQNSTGAGGSIDLKLGGELAMDGGQISSTTTGDRNAGEISVTAGSIRITSHGFIASNTLFGSGHGGTITINTNDLAIDPQGNSEFTGVSARSFESASGIGGTIVINSTGPISINGGGDIVVEAKGVGPAGTIEITANDLSIAGAASLISSATIGTGHGGNITLHAHCLTIDQAAIQATTGASPDLNITTPDDPAAFGGDVDLVVDRLRFSHGGIVTTSTFRSARAGVVDVLASESVVIQDPGSGLFAETNLGDHGVPTGKGGSVKVRAPATASLNVSILDGGTISSTTRGTGLGGPVTVQASNILLDGGASVGFTGIASNSQFVGDGAQSGGSVSISAKDSIHILAGAGIAARSFGPGRAGAIDVSTGNLVIDGRHGTGTTGINVQTTKILADGGQISVNARDSIEMKHGLITTEASRDGGNISLVASGSIQIFDSKITAEAGRNGASISIDPVFVILNHSTINGLSGGNDVKVTIVADNFFASESQILTNTGISFPATDISGSLILLPVGLLVAENRLADSCLIRVQQNASSLTIRGLGALAPDPEGWLPAGSLRFNGGTAKHELDGR